MKGKNLFEEIFPEHAQQIHTLMSSLTDTEKQEAIDLLKKLGLPAGNFNTAIWPYFFLLKEY